VKQTLVHNASLNRVTMFDHFFQQKHNFQTDNFFSLFTYWLNKVESFGTEASFIYQIYYNTSQTNKLFSKQIFLVWSNIKSFERKKLLAKNNTWQLVFSFSSLSEKKNPKNISISVSPAIAFSTIPSKCSTKFARGEKISKNERWPAILQI